MKTTVSIEQFFINSKGKKIVIRTHGETRPDDGTFYRQILIALATLDKLKGAE